MSGSSCVPWNIGAVQHLGAVWPLKTCIFRGFGAAVNHHSIAASSVLCLISAILVWIDVIMFTEKISLISAVESQWTLVWSRSAGLGTASLRWAVIKCFSTADTLTTGVLSVGITSWTGQRRALQYSTFIVNRCKAESEARAVARSKMMWWH